MSSSPAAERPPSRGRAWLRRHDSLLRRLLLAQTAMVLAVGGLFALLFYVERNVSVAELFAQRWGPALVQLAHPAQPAPPSDADRQALLTRPGDGDPRPAHRPWQQAPRFVALRRGLAEQGVVVDDLMLSIAAGPEPRIWLHLQRSGAAPLWVGLPAQVLVPEWSLRPLLLLVAGVALLAAGMALFTRWLIRPLEALRARIAPQAPPRGPPPLAAQPAAAGAADAQAPAASTARLLGTPPEIRAIEAAHEAALAQLAQQGRERALLLAGVSHDLRSPLARIRLNAELLPDDDPAWARRKAALVRNVAQADRLIESFLDHVRAGELPLDETVDLAEVARSVAAPLRAAAGSEGEAIDMRVDLPERLLRPQCHRLLMERLLANLLDNARLHGRAPLGLALAATPEGGVCLSVSDAGDGLSPDEARALTAAFARGDRSRGRPGSGLGLAIVQQVTERLQGRLVFERLDPPQGPWRHRVSVWLAAPPGRPTRS
jgi:two-component system osmolarity sensor histidine kinase EnvZ